MMNIFRYLCFWREKWGKGFIHRFYFNGEQIYKYEYLDICGFAKEEN